MESKGISSAEDALFSHAFDKQLNYCQIENVYLIIYFLVFSCLL